MPSEGFRQQINRRRLVFLHQRPQHLVSGLETAVRVDDRRSVPWLRVDRRNQRVAQVGIRGTHKQSGRLHERQQTLRFLDQLVVILRAIPAFRNPAGAVRHRAREAILLDHGPVVLAQKLDALKAHGLCGFTQL